MGVEPARHSTNLPGWVDVIQQGVGVSPLCVCAAGNIMMTPFEYTRNNVKTYCSAAIYAAIVQWAHARFGISGDSCHEGRCGRVGTGHLASMCTQKNIPRPSSLISLRLAQASIYHSMENK